MAASQEHLGTGQISLCELEWFSRNSYNLVLQHCTTWEPQHVLRLLNSCIKVCPAPVPVFARVLIRFETLDLYPADIGPVALSDVTLRKLFCYFLGAIVNVAQARMQENPEVQVLPFLLSLYRSYGKVNNRRFFDRKTTTSILGSISNDFEGVSTASSAEVPKRPRRSYRISIGRCWLLTSKLPFD